MSQNFGGCWDEWNIFCMGEGNEFGGVREQEQNAMDWIVSPQNLYVEVLANSDCTWNKEVI